MNPTSQLGCTQIEGLRAATVGQPDASREVLAFMGFRACVEPFELRRFALLAEAWDARLTVVDAPGWGHGHARLTRTERRALRRGDFTAVARRMVRTAQRHHPALRMSSVLLVGYSMGASLACAAAADPDLLSTTAVVLVEPVAMRPRRVSELTRSILWENKFLASYLGRNRAVSDSAPPARLPPHRCAVDLAHLGFALSRGKLTGDLLRGSLTRALSVQVVRGAQSRMSRPADVAELVSTCRCAGVTVHEVLVLGHHALWQSLPDVAALAAAVRGQWCR